MDATRAPLRVEAMYCSSATPKRWLLQTKVGTFRPINQSPQSNGLWKEVSLTMAESLLCSFAFQNCKCFTILQFHMLFILRIKPMRCSHLFNGIWINFCSPLYGPWNGEWFFQQPNPIGAKFCPMNQTKRSFRQMTKQRHWWNASDRTNVFVEYRSFVRHGSISIRSMSCLWKEKKKHTNHE